MNSKSDEEKALINRELKEVYASLTPEDQKLFNEELQSFLINEMAMIKSIYDTSKN
jgi:hypothetical protein